MNDYRRIIYHGRVQGVGFRYSVKRTAGGYDVIGTVRNLPDGTVELRAGGTHDELDGFLAAIAEGDLAQHIKEMHSSPLDPFPESVRGFEIRV